MRSSFRSGTPISCFVQSLCVRYFRSFCSEVTILNVFPCPNEKKKKAESYLPRRKVIPHSAQMRSKCSLREKLLSRTWGTLVRGQIAQPGKGAERIQGEDYFMDICITSFLFFQF